MKARAEPWLGQHSASTTRPGLFVHKTDWLEEEGRNDGKRRRKGFGKEGGVGGREREREVRKGSNVGRERRKGQGKLV